jgi:hypothetical protein
MILAVRLSIYYLNNFVCGGQSGTGTGFPTNYLVSVAPYSFEYHLWDGQRAN